MLNTFFPGMISICIVPVSPLRSEASHKSEMVSQLLFGEYCEVVEQKPDWKKIRCQYDNYEGWCQDIHLAEASLPAGQGKLNYQYTADLQFDGRPMRICFGSPLDVFEQTTATIGKHTLVYEGKHWITQKPQGDLLRAIAMEYINTPYLWGGRSVFGVDCSGFVQTVFRFFGIKLLRDAYQQATQGEVIGFLQEARMGDLAFFDNEDGRIVHVGMLLSESEIIHASGKVRIDKIDHQGILNVDTGLRTHKLRLIRRYF